jgi:hypothetical protein
MTILHKPATKILEEAVGSVAKSERERERCMCIDTSTGKETT